MRLRRLGAIAVLSIALLACDTPDRTGVTITVAGAASLQDALNAAATRYENTHAWSGIQFTFDASSALRAQIEQGAPVDAFVSADIANPQQLVDHGLAEGPVRVIARNQLVIVVPRSTSAVATPADLSRPGVKVVAAGLDVPISRYAGQLIANLANLAGYPPDYSTKVAANIVSREANVRAIVAKIALGEGDAGIVYATDATSADVGTVQIPAGSNVITTYGAVTIKASHHATEARAFLDWLAEPDGQAVLAPFGFLPATP